MKKNINRLRSLAFAFLVPLAFAACSEKDNPVPDPDTPSGPSEAPTEDVIKTYINCSVATLGSEFDETTERLIARASGGVGTRATNARDIPEGTGVVFIDTQALDRILAASDADNYSEIVWLNHLFQNGTVLMLHKPDNTAATVFTLLMYWDSFVLNPDGTYSLAAPDLSRLNDRKTKVRSRDSEEDTPDALDLYGMRDGFHYYYVPDLYGQGMTEKASFKGILQIDDGEETVYTLEDEFEVQKPTQYQYGLYAEEGARWINETAEELESKGSGILGSRSDVTGDVQFFDQISSTTYTVNWKDWVIPKNKNNCPVTFSFWVSSMYSFDRDEDYYHIVMQEKIPAQVQYDGPYKGDGYSYPGDRTFWWPMGFELEWYCGASVANFLISTKWNESKDYPLRDEWNILPQGKAAPTTYETMSGWDLNTDISFGKSVTGKLSAKYQSTERVTTTQNDVSVTSRSKVNAFGSNGWIQWEYVLGNQPEFGGSKGKVKMPSVPSNAACISEQLYRQSWNWMVRDTQKRGNVAFEIPVRFNIYSRYCFAHSGFLRTVKYRVTEEGHSRNNNFSIQLPVPERVRKIYSFTLDNSDDAAELSNLLSVMEKVVPNFKGLFQTLQRTDSKGALLGRTGPTLADLQNTVGAEWYALAREIAARKFGVKHTYRFYVKDMGEPDAKLVMKSREGGAWKDMGVYVEIGPDGSRILTQAQADAESKARKK